MPLKWEAHAASRAASRASRNTWARLRATPLVPRAVRPTGKAPVATREGVCTPQNEPKQFRTQMTSYVKGLVVPVHRGNLYADAEFSQ
jgi:hypothetical protein